MSNLKVNNIIFHKPSKREGKIVAFGRDMGRTAKIEFIISFNRETGERTTVLETVQVKDLVLVRNDKRKTLQLKVKYFDNEIDKLKKVNIGDWIDLRAAETFELKQGEFKLIPLGIGIKLPHGYEANIVPRSSTFKNFGVLQTNSYGVIDNSYSGNDDQYHFPALAMRDTVINKNDRICQMRINRVMPELNIIEVEFLDETSRGGFGSSGVN